MNFFKIIPIIYIKDGMAFSENGKLICENATELALTYCNNGADEIILFDMSDNDLMHEKNINCMKDVYAKSDISFIAGGNIKRLEDVKKYIYAGAKAVILDMNIKANIEMIDEAKARFGENKILTQITDSDKKLIEGTKTKISIIDFDIKTALNCAKEGFSGTASADFSTDTDFMNIKHTLKSNGIKANVFESDIKFSSFKTNTDNMIPVIVQDYKTNKVLMLAYMNEEAYNLTLKTGRMTYYSRSRDEIWVKGLTSGSFQYVKELSMDCDNDTMLAKVLQIGVPCHTGADTCFFNNIVKKEYDDRNPLKVFEDVYSTIADRKENPKDGSYTNYLFDKGIDKILKKVGEEATEIVIAAKNPDEREMIYEVSDLLYHLMVLMAEKGITWEDITNELARRH